MDEIILGLCIPSALSSARMQFIRTLVFWQALQVYLDGEVVSRLGLDNVRPVLALQDGLCTILDEFVEAFDAQRHDNLGLALGSRDVEGDAIKVGDDLVNVGWSSSVRC